MADEQTYDVGRGISLCAQTFGDDGAPPVLLVAGLGQQLLSWPEELCAMLAGHGLRVIRYDNRDTGCSTHLRHIPPPGTLQLLTRRGFAAAQYDLGDMAADAVGLLDALGIERAHVVGVSMGGMIGQTLAARHPGRVQSVVSIMSTTGHRRKGQPAPSTLRLMLRKPPRNAETAAAMAVAMFRHVGSAGYPFDEDLVRDLATQSWARGGDPAGTGRQLAAILKSGDRTRELRAVAAPTLVIHGDRDRMVHPSGGKATAAAIRGARLETVPGMGHDLPRGAWPRLVDLIAAHVRAAGGPAGAAQAGRAA